VTNYDGDQEQTEVGARYETPKMTKATLVDSRGGSILDMREWSERAATLIECADDTGALAEAILAVLQGVRAVNVGYVSVYSEPRNSRSPDKMWLHPASLEIPHSYFRRELMELDPFSVAVAEGRSGVLKLWELAPQGFEDSEVYRRHYTAFGEADEVLHVKILPQGLAVYAGAGASKRLTDEEIARHDAAHPLIEAGLTRLAMLLAPSLVEGHAERTPGIDAALNRFGSDVLTKREQEVVHLILRGHNSESVAHQLGISWNTARGHRTRAYAKLRVNSQGDLFNAFLHSLHLPTDHS